QPRCTCSAFFKTEDDLERHLDANFREQWIQWLQTEARRYQAHARVDNGNHTESDSENNRHDGEPAISKPNNLSGQHFCPSCPRTKPFATNQKLRRHFEQHVECHEVCVCCTKVFRLVREFRRHAENCTDESKRKMTYMKQTCDELREFSDKELDNALGESLSSVGKSRKRTWDEAEMDTEVLGNQAKANRPELGAPERVNTRQPPGDKAAGAPNTETLPSYTGSMSDMGSIIGRDSGGRMCLGPTQQQQSQGFSIEAAVHHIPSLDLLDNFDAPLMQIMNGVPVFTNQWVLDGHDGDAPSNAAA
ncbi:hypothetical protein B0J13DRAFT_394436, partial [Dactylonectria estremocensis]